MRRLVLLAALLTAVEAKATEPLPNQTLVFFNARLSLRDDRPQDALKLWLLRNSLKHLGEPGTHDPEFRSVVWAALGKTGYCPDGFAPDDEGGAGLWPLALHNHVVLSMARGPAPPVPPPFDVFQIGRQQRLVSLNDVLSSEELESVEFFRTTCARPQLFWVQSGNTSLVDLEDRLGVGQMLEALLEESLETLVREKVRNVAVVEARLFDLKLALAELQGMDAQREGRRAALEARDLGVSEKAADEVRRQAAQWPSDSEGAAFLRRSLAWSASEWLSLERGRRLNLFAQAAPLAPDEEVVAGLARAIIDGLIERRAGDEVEDWLGFLAHIDPDELREVTDGARGRRLLELEPETGFRGRGTIALHRGVSFLESGRRLDALRSFAGAMRYAQEARDGDAVRSLARRWLGYVLSRYETYDEVIAILRALVPRQEYNSVIEGLVFRAAFHADRASYERLLASTTRGGSFDLRVGRLRPLAEGRVGDLVTALRDDLTDEPYAVLRFLQQLLEQLETEDADVRRANVPLLNFVRELLLPVTEGENRGHARRAEALLARGQAILDGLAHLDDSLEGQARAHAPTHETFAGNIRLAPADPLPWPFRAPDTAAPSPFLPLVLKPVEWRNDAGELVFGWELSE